MHSTPSRRHVVFHGTNTNQAEQQVCEKYEELPRVVLKTRHEVDDHARHAVETQCNKAKGG